MLVHNSRSATKKFCGAKCRDTYWNCTKSGNVKRGQWRVRKYGEALPIQMTDAAAAYVAGFMDGEGHVGLCREVRKGNKSGFSYKCIVEAANTNHAVLEKVHGLLGGMGWISGGERNNHRFANAKPLYRLRFSAQQARSILPTLLPHFVVKREAALLAMRFFEAVDALPMRASRDHEALDALWQESHRLNKRGR